MARAKATCTCSKCGGTFEKVKYNCANRSDADRWEAWAVEYFDTCPDCWKQEQKEASEKVHQKQMEYGFAELRGPEWLVQKAVEQRQKFIDFGLRKFSAEIIQQLKGETEVTEPVIAKAKEIASADWWDTPGDALNRICDILDKEEKASEEEKKQEKAPEPQKPEKFTLVAEDALDVSCELVAGKGKVIVKTSGYSKKVTDVMHAQKYTWDRTFYWWYRIMPEEKIEDGIAEIGAQLNQEHITCTYPSRDIADKAINGTYEVENKRWILSVTKDGEATGWLALEFEKGAGVYEAAMKIKGARYRNYQIEVFMRNYREIRDFAQIYNFQISKAADEVMKTEEANSMIGSAMVKKLESEGKTLEDILNSSRDVLEDLKDD